MWVLLINEMVGILVFIKELEQTSSEVSPVCVVHLFTLLSQLTEESS